MRTISGDDDSSGSDRVRRRVIGIIAGIKIDEVSVFLRQSAVPIETQSSGDGEIGTHLIFVLDIFSGFVGAPVAVRISVELDRSGVKIIVFESALKKLVDILRFNGSQFVSTVTRVELRVRETSAESQGVLSESPDGARGGIESVLENSGECRQG